MDSQPPQYPRQSTIAPLAYRRWEPATVWLLLLLLAPTAIVYVGSAGIPPLLNDTDSLYAEVAREMNLRADWITPYANGLRYFEKPPLFYWLMSLSYAVFGAEDEFTARLPTALAVVALVGVTFAIGRELFGTRAGFFGALALASSAGLFLFTRIVMPDALLTLVITLYFYAFLRWERAADKTLPLLWMYALAGTAVLVKGLVGAVLPAAGTLAALAATGRAREVRGLISLKGTALCLAICGSWLALMELNNPGFLWYYVVNEHILRFLGTRQPMDYGRLPLLSFWNLHLVWLFPWSIYLAALAWPANFRRAAAAHGRQLVLPFAWAGAVIVFFSLSSSRLEYYTMPALPALALLAGVQCAACWQRGRSWSGATLVVGGIAIGAALFAASEVDPIALARNLMAADSDPERLSYFGHIFDLSARRIEALHTALRVAAVALGIVLPLHHWMRTAQAKAAVLVAAMLILFGAAESAFWIFAPRLSSAAMASEINRRWDKSALIVVDGDFEDSSSIAFYTHQPLILHDGHSVNLDYGAHYPDAPPLRVDGRELGQLWSREKERVFVVTDETRQARLAKIIARPIYVLSRHGGQLLLSNIPDELTTFDDDGWSLL